MDRANLSHFEPQTEPLWVGFRENFEAMSGRVVGWVMDDTVAAFPRSDLEEPSGLRARAVVMVHGSNRPRDDEYAQPIITIDANWPCRFTATAEEAWRLALELQAQFKAEMIGQDAANVAFFRHEESTK
jgi:hypothetical protein